MVALKKAAEQCDSVVDVLVLRRRATRDNEGIRDDVMKSGVKQYLKLAGKISKASSQVPALPSLTLSSPSSPCPPLAHLVVLVNTFLQCQ